MGEKLIRDRIPKIAADSGDSITVRSALAAELPALLRNKLTEEAAEAVTAEPHELLEELADVIEVVHALGALHGHAPEDIEKSRVAKTSRRGGFTLGLVLVASEKKSMPRMLPKTLVTSHQMKIVQCIADGDMREQIAQLLGVGGRTVQSHVERMLRATESPNQAALVSYAYKHGLLKIPAERRTPPLRLRPEEQKILVRAAHGMTTMEIAEDLDTSPNVVKVLFQRVYDKVKAKRRAQAVAIGWQEGLLMNENTKKCVAPACPCQWEDA